MPVAKYAIAVVVLALSGAASAEPAKTAERASPSADSRPAAAATTASAPAASVIPIAATQAAAQAAVTGKRGRTARVSACRCGGQAPAAN